MATLNPHPIRINIIGSPMVGQQVEVKVLIGHPMETGYRLCDGGNERIPKNIIDKVTIRLNQEIVLQAELGTGIAANPLFSIFVTVPSGAAMISVDWEDDQGVKGRAEKLLVST
jgi:sulfur-oxidizing protein SoxZ